MDIAWALLWHCRVFGEQTVFPRQVCWWKFEFKSDRGKYERFGKFNCFVSRLPSITRTDFSCWAIAEDTFHRVLRWTLSKVHSNPFQKQNVKKERLQEILEARKSNLSCTVRNDWGREIKSGSRAYFSFSHEQLFPAFCKGRKSLRSLHLGACIIFSPKIEPELDAISQFFELMPESLGS